MKLDREKEYYEVFGIGGVSFEQDGHFFDGSGDEVTLGGEMVEDRHKNNNVKTVAKHIQDSK